MDRATAEARLKAIEERKRALKVETERAAAAAAVAAKSKAAPTK